MTAKITGSDDGLHLARLICAECREVLWYVNWGDTLDLLTTAATRHDCKGQPQ
jgi:hypothetical protein